MLETIEQALLSRHYDTINDTINEIEETIIHLIQQNPKITIDEIIKYTGNSRSTITRALSTLKKGFAPKLNNYVFYCLWTHEENRR